MVHSTVVTVTSGGNGMLPVVVWYTVQWSQLPVGEWYAASSCMYTVQWSQLPVVGMVCCQ